MDPVWRHRELNPEFAGISKHSESNLGKKGYKKGLGSLSWVRIRRLTPIVIKAVTTPIAVIAGLLQLCSKRCS